MAISKWRTLVLTVTLVLLSFVQQGRANLSSNSSLVVNTNSSQLIYKHFCDDVLRRDGRETLKNISLLSFDDILIRSSLLCPNDELVYKNITESDFSIGIRENGALECSSLHTKFEPRTFCVKDYDHVSQTVQIAFCKSSLVIRKCCSASQRLAKSTVDGRDVLKCVDAPKDSIWNPAIFNSTSDDFDEHIDFNDMKNVRTIYGKPNSCEGNQYKYLNSSIDIWFMLLTSGSVEIGLKFWFKPVWLPVKDNEYCMDEVLDHDPSFQKNSASHKRYHKNQILLYCQIADFDDYLFHRKLFGGMCVAAAGVVFILLVIYVAIYDKQNLAGWTQFNIFVALFFVVLMEGLRTLIDADALKVQSTTSCVIIAAIAQYFFFALNTAWSVMCFDLFYMFWKLETTSKTVARYRNRLVGYLLFSWGLPFVFVCLGFYFTHQYATKEMSELRGIYAFAHRRCSSPIRKLGFQAQGIMFLLNLMFFLLTTLLIWKHRRGLNAARKRTRNERHTWRSVCLFMKLVFVMGVASLSIPLDYFFVSSAPLSGTAICFRMIHFIPFVAVLFIFGFNEKNVILISQKYPRVGKYFGFVACTAGATASDTINHSRSGNHPISDHPSSPT